MLVLTVLSLLTGILVPTVGRVMQGGDRDRCTEELRKLALAFDDYHADVGEWPTNVATRVTRPTADPLASFTCLKHNASRLERWNGPYAVDPEIDGFDAWGRQYLVYVFPAEYCRSGGGIALLSAGADGVVDSCLSGILSGMAADDDLVQIVTTRL